MLPRRDTAREPARETCTGVLPAADLGPGAASAPNPSEVGSEGAGQRRKGSGWRGRPVLDAGGEGCTGTVAGTGPGDPCNSGCGPSRAAPSSGWVALPRLPVGGTGVRRFRMWGPITVAMTRRPGDGGGE